MIPHIVLFGVNADLLYAWLPDCIDLARQEQNLNPLRPQARRMAPALLEARHMPYYLRRQADWFVGVYARLPVEAPPLGESLLLLGGRQMEGERIGVSIYRSDAFPLLLYEVAWSLEERFAVDPDHPSLVPAYLRPAGHRAATPAADGDAGPAPGTPAGRQHILQVNRWLEQQLARLTNPADSDGLFDDWLTRYVAEQGINPRDPRRSFERAVDGAMRRLSSSNDRQA